MGAYKNIDVTGDSKNTAAATGSCTITHFRIVDASDNPKTNWVQLTQSKTLATGEMLNIADAGIVIRAGTQGASVTGEIANSVLVSMLDAGFPTGASTDKIQWSENGSTVTSNLAATSVDGWAAAEAWV